MARVKNLGKPMDPVDAKATVATLQTYVANKRLSYERTAGALMEWFIEDPDNAFRFQPFSINELDFDIDENTIGKVISKGHIPSNQYIKAIYLWLMSIKQCNVDFADNKKEEILRSKEGEILSVRRLFGFISDLRNVKPSSWDGDYALYRPFHLDPLHKVQVNHLKIGSEESEFDCQLTSSFEGIFGGEQTNVGSGKFTPLDKDHAVALMVMNQKLRESGFVDEGNQTGGYTLHFSDPQRGTNVIGFRGILVASEGPNPSAWPIYARRLNSGEKLTPHVLTADEYRALPSIITQQLDRGGVYWNEPDFPKAISQAHAEPKL